MAEPAAANDTTEQPGVASRRLAIEAMVRIETGGAFANLVLPSDARVGPSWGPTIGGS